jgi:hypothetical protein
MNLAWAKIYLKNEWGLLLNKKLLTDGKHKRDWGYY